MIDTLKGRMHELVGKAREEDEQFWQQLGFFQEAESDDDYVESSAGEDVVDSDFDQPEEENENENETESTKVRDSKKKPPPPTVPRRRPHAQPAKAPNSDINAQGDAEADIQPAKKVKRLAAEVSLPLEQVQLSCYLLKHLQHFLRDQWRCARRR